jgi:hypothetical protein
MPGDGGDGGSSSAGTAGRNGGHAGSTGKAGGSGEGATGGSEFGGNAGNGATGGSETGGFGSDGGTGFGGFGFGGTDTGGFGVGGQSYGGQSFPAFGGTGSSGYSGFDSGGFGGSGTPGCFDPFGSFGMVGQVDLGPQNSVLLDVHPIGDQVRNSADQIVFPNAFYIFEAYGNFPAVSAELAAKTDISLPAQLSTVPNSVAEIHVTRANCLGMPVAGHKLEVEVWWKSNGAFVSQPTHGFALGVLDKDDKPAWLADSTKAFVVGDGVEKRELNTLNRIIVQHTFAAKDMTDARKLVLAFWVLAGDEFPTSFYVGNVKWD